MVLLLVSKNRAEPDTLGYIHPLRCGLLDMVPGILAVGDIVLIVVTERGVVAGELPALLGEGETGFILRPLIPGGGGRGGGCEGGAPGPAERGVGGNTLFCIRDCRYALLLCAGRGGSVEGEFLGGEAAR